MSLITKKIRFGSEPSYIYGTDAYDSTKLGLGPQIKQYTDTAPSAKYISPSPLSLGRPMETAGGAAQAPSSVAWSSNLDWVFFGDQTGVSTTRTVKLFTYNRTTFAFTFIGFITLPYVGGNVTTRSINAVYEKYITGTAAVSGNEITGTSTAWSAGGVCPGSRIAFGTTDPTTNPTWYEIGTPVTFTITSGSATAGTTYTNNTHTFTVLKTIASQTVLSTVGTGLPTLTAGTLTKVGVGAGDGTLSFTINWGIGFYQFTASSPANATEGAVYTISNAYTFIITAGTAQVGATYTNNGQTFTVVTASLAGTVLQTTGTGAPSTGTLVRTSAASTGDTPLTFSAWVVPNFSVNTTLVNGTNLITTGTHWPLTSGTLTKVSGTGDATIVYSAKVYDTVLDDKMYLTAPAGTIADGTYVVEDLRIVQLVTNATATNGGLFLVKGLRYENFNGTGTTATIATYHNGGPRVNYWLKDFPVVLNTVGIGSAVVPKLSWTTQYVYTLDTVANPVLEKYNIRADLPALSTVGAAGSTGAYVLRSGSFGATTGSASQNNNFIIATTSHGNGSGISCGYFTTATRFYRTIDINQITFGSVNWAGDACLEVPPGGTTTFNATGTLNSLSYSTLLDKFVVTTGNRAYLTQFKSDGSQWDRIFLGDNKQVNQSTASGDIPLFVPFGVGPPFWVETCNGIMYLVTTGATAALNFIYVIPFNTDWEYTSTMKNVAISPVIQTPNVSSYFRVFINCQDIANGVSTSSKNLGVVTEGVRLSYRTSGITDDTGAWTLLSQYGDLSGALPSSSIQFKVEWRTLGNSCIPSRVYSFGCNYYDMSTDSHYQVSMGNSTINKVFAWRFATAFGTATPRLKIRIYDAITNLLLLTDDTTTTPANWAKSTDGGSSWGAYNTTDKANEITYIKYTPTSLGDNMKVRPLLTQYV